MPQQTAVIAGEWDRVCDEAKLSQTDKNPSARRSHRDGAMIKAFCNEAGIEAEDYGRIRLRRRHLPT
jgi:hypothetical protein